MIFISAIKKLINKSAGIEHIGVNPAFWITPKRGKYDQITYKGIYMTKQIYGYTPRQPAEDDYVKFLCVMGDDDGNITITVRNARGGINEIVVPKFEARKLGDEIAKWTKL